MPIETAPKLTTPRVAAAYLGSRYRSQLGFSGLVGLDKNGEVIFEQEMNPEASKLVPREVVRQALCGAKGTISFVAFTVADRPADYADLIRNAVLAVRAAGESIGVPMVDFLVLDHSSEDKNAFVSFRAMEAWMDHR